MNNDELKTLLATKIRALMWHEDSKGMDHSYSIHLNARNEALGEALAVIDEPLSKRCQHCGLHPIEYQDEPSEKSDAK